MLKNIADELEAEYSEKAGFDIQISIEDDFGESIRIFINDIAVDVSKSTLDSGELDAFIGNFSETDSEGG